MNSNDKIRSLKLIAVITGVAAAFIGLLMLLNYFQLRAHDPLNSETLVTLTERLSNDPNNEVLKEEIRALDLMARKAFFTAQWQIKTGSYLLIALVVICIATLRYRMSLLHNINIPEQSKEDELKNRKTASKWITGAIVLFTLLSVFAAFYANKTFTDYSTLQPAVAENDSETEEIEVIALYEEPLETSTEEINTTEEIDTLSRKEITEAADETATEPVEETETIPEPEPEKPAAPAFPNAGEYKPQHASFRGPFAQGVVYATNAPQNWDGASGENIKWKVALDNPGYSSPVIWDDKLFLTTGDENARILWCYNAADGTLLWQHEAKDIQGSPATMPKTTDDTGLAAPTPATNGIQVFAIFGSGDIVATDMNGNRLWAKNLGVPDNHYGYSSSLICLNNHVFVQYDDNKRAKVMALNAETGDVEWETVRKNKISWSSPVLAEINGKYQLILTANPTVSGYDVETGEELWSVDCLSGEVGPSAGFYKNKIIAANEYANLVVIDAANDYSILWESMDYLPEVSSPVVANDILFIATSYGMLVAFDINSGDILWEQDYGDGFYGSPVVTGENLYIFELSGKAYIIKAAAEYTEIATPELGEDVFTTPAFAKGRLYIRGENHLFCIGK